MQRFERLMNGQIVVVAVHEHAADGVYICRKRRKI